MPDPAGLLLPDTEEFTAYPLAELLSAPELPSGPEDFADFWRETYDELTRPPTEPRHEGDLSSSGRPVELISFRSSTGDRVLGWLVGPAARQPIRRGLVIGHGYGGRAEPELGLVAADTAAIFPIAPWLPDNPGGLPGAEHVLLGIGDRYRYAHRFSVADLWRAATVLLDRYPDAAGCLDYWGSSFGGGIGALALPWDPRFRRSVLNVPSFGNFPVRLSRRCTGSGEAVRLHLLDHPEHRPMLDYFDSARAAELITIEVLIGAARLDPAVDPRGQFAIYHALAGAKRLVVRSAGHAEFAEEQTENDTFDQEGRRFLGAAPEISAVPSMIDLSGCHHSVGAGRPVTDSATRRGNL